MTATLSSLAARLTDPQDRETYGALVSYVDSLPESDELFRLIELLGLLTLLSQRVPDAVGELLIELRSQTTVATEYHERLEGRLASLPLELAAGVDAGAIVKAMSESFRQQIAATGLQDTAALLEGSAKAIKQTTGEVSCTLKLYRGVASSLSSELAKLQTASNQLQQDNRRLVLQERRNARLWKGLLLVIVFLVGGVCGTLFEKGQTADLLNHIDARIQRIETSAITVMSRPHFASPATRTPK